MTMQGWQGKVLRIDLDGASATPEALDPDVAQACIGGRGLAAGYLFKELEPNVNPLAPQNKLVIAAGPLAGTAAPAGSRYQVVGKSPLTKRISCQNAGGHFGAAIKQAGYDAILIQGKANNPVYVWIENDKIEIRPADSLWGKTTGDAQQSISKQIAEGAHVLCIGPAGEVQTPVASISDSGLWSAGGAGLGAVMGSKNLKAVAIKGAEAVAVADRDRFRAAMRRALKRIQSEHLTSTRFAAYGTGALVHPINDRGLLPTENFRRGTFAAASKISGEAVADSLLLRRFACFACPIGCGRHTRGNGRGTEIEHLWALGSNCGIDDLSAISQAAHLCYEYGLDPVETGSAIAVAMELAESGAISAKDAGRELRFGDATAMVQLVHEISRQEGFGRILAKGGHHVANAFGNPDTAIGVREHALAAYDPRGNEALALHYATSLSGDDHLALGLRLWDRPLAAAVKQAQDLAAAMGSAGVCPLVSFAIPLEDAAQLLTAATGVDYDADGLLLAGERIWNLERAFALKAGTDAKDRLPARMEQPLQDGPSAGRLTSVSNHLQSYYQSRGWDVLGL